MSDDEAKFLQYVYQQLCFLQYGAPSSTEGKPADTEIPFDHVPDGRSLLLPEPIIQSPDETVRSKRDKVVQIMQKIVFKRQNVIESVQNFEAKWDDDIEYVFQQFNQYVH